MHYAFSYRATKPVSCDGRSVAQFVGAAVQWREDIRRKNPAILMNRLLRIVP